MNASYYAIITYIILILFLFVSKPNFIYDHERQKFKDFGFGESKSIISLPIVAIVLAIIIYIIFFQLCSTDQTNKLAGGFKKHKMKHMMPMNYYYPFAPYPYHQVDLTR
jgi:hypothetical protein